VRKTNIHLDFGTSRLEQSGGEGRSITARQTLQAENCRSEARKSLVEQLFKSNHIGKYDD